MSVKIQIIHLQSIKKILKCFISIFLKNTYLWSFGLIKINNFVMMKVFHKEQPLYLTNKAQENF